MSRPHTLSPVLVLLVGIAWATACGDGTTQPPTPDPPRATTLTVTPANSQLEALGETVRLTAEVRDQNGQVMTGAAVTWVSGDASVAAVDASGLATAAGNGATTITATSGTASGSAAVTVAQAVRSVAISPAADTLLARGDTLRLAAEALDANGHAVTGAEFSWASSDTTVATVDASGLVTGIGPGDVGISASSSGIAGQASLAIVEPVPTAIVVTPDTLALTALAQTAELSAAVRDQAGRMMEGVAVSWSSADTMVAAVDTTGLVTAVGGGVTAVFALAGEVSGTAMVTVVQSGSSVVVSPAKGAVALGDTLRLSAEAFDANGHPVAGTEFSWSSSDPAVATVDRSALVRGVGEGTALITAAAGDVEGTSEIKVANPDRAALVALYEGTDGPNWTDSDNWLTDAPLGDWHGVRTEGSGRVVSLNLAGEWSHEKRDWIPHGLTGPIPSELGNLVRLAWLDLGGNRLTGSLPPELGDLANLEGLLLSSNALTGPIPSELGNLSSLRNLRIDNNGLEGSIPADLGNLADLEVLRLGNNQLTGSIPLRFGGLDNLRHLWLGGNGLTGAIPAELGGLAKLEHLSLGWSQLEGSIPAELGELSKLRELYLTANKLTGSIPRSFLGLTKLTRFDFSENEGLCAPGTPAFVAWLGEAGTADGSYCNESDRTVLEVLYDATGGTGWTESAGWLGEKSALGEWHGITADSLGRVTTLDLTRNGLSGDLPRSLGELTQMSILRVGRNALTGRLPLSLTRLSLAEFRYTATDLCTPPDETFQRWLGSIPVHEGTDVQCAPLSDRETLEVLYKAMAGASWFRSDNWLTNAPLSEWFGVTVDGQERVVELHLEENGLKGLIPQELGGLTNLRALYLGVNEVTGPIPPELGNLTDLRHLSLHGSWERGAQRLNGPIPPELGDLARLRRLDLGLNHLTGPIPSELANLTGLATLSLRANRLTGAIPPQLANLTNLRDLYLGVNQLTGSIPPELGNLTDLRHLSLKLNDLGGAIPNELGNLTALTRLDLGANKLTDPIPPELGNLTDLENLRLEDNDLRGSVPSELGRMTNLRSLHVGKNAGLTGPLPADLTALGQLDELVAGHTDLCAPSDTRFQAWLEGVRTRRVATCGHANRGAAYLVQTAQSLEFPVPLIAGEKALLRVFPTARSATAAGIPAVRARFYRNGRETHVEHIPGKSTPIPVDVDEGSLSQSANAEIPGHIVMPGLEMVIEVDPEATLDPALGIATRIPETGRLAVEVEAMPTFRLTLVPFLWRTAPDSAVLGITSDIADDPEGHPLLEKTRTILPVGDIEVKTHEPVLTSYNRARSLSREARAIWAMEGGSGHLLGLMTGRFSGIVANSTQNGRVVVSRIQGRHDADILAHEFGHNMSLRHPPPRDRDPPAVHVTDFAYPHADGAIGVWGYDLTGPGSLVPPHTGDVMGRYAGSPWISDYHFTNAIRYRMADEGAASTESAPSTTTRSLLLWGGIDGEGRPDLEPAFVVDAPAAQPVSPGPWRITGRNATGAEVFSVSFDMPVMAHGDGASSFVFLLPVQPGWPEKLASITLSGPTGSVSLDGESDLPVAILRNPRSGQIRGILRDLPQTALVQGDVAAGMALTSAGAAAALSPEPGLEVLFSRGIPDKTAWRR